MLTKKELIIIWLWALLYLLSFVPLLEFLLVLASNNDNTLFSEYVLISLLTGWLTIEVDIKFYRQIQLTIVWQNRIGPWLNKFKLADNNSERFNWANKIVVKLEYFGLMIANSIPGFGFSKLASFIYVNSLNTLRWGRPWLYFGVVIKIIFLYYGFDLIF